MSRRRHRSCSYRLFAGVLALLALVSHGVANVRHAVAMAAPGSAVSAPLEAGISAALAADLAVTCHGGRVSEPQDGGTAPHEKSSSCPLCKGLCGAVAVPPLAAVALTFEPGARLQHWRPKAVPLTALSSRMRPPGRGPPALV